MGRERRSQFTDKKRRLREALSAVTRPVSGLEELEPGSVYTGVNVLTCLDLIFLFSFCTDTL